MGAAQDRALTARLEAARVPPCGGSACGPEGIEISPAVVGGCAVVVDREGA